MSKATKSPNVAVTPADAVEYLNQLLVISPETIQTLVALRIPAPKALVDHPAVQVQSPTVGIDGPPVVGLLGILNGLFGADSAGMGAIAAVYDDDWRLTHFQYNWCKESVTRLAIEAIIADAVEAAEEKDNG